MFRDFEPCGNFFCWWMGRVVRWERKEIHSFGIDPKQPQTDELKYFPKQRTQFHCCGFSEADDRAVDSPTCPIAEAQTSTQFGCREAVATNATKVMVIFYTALFGSVVVDVFAFLACVVMAQYRKDEERFRRIDSRGPLKI